MSETNKPRQDKECRKCYVVKTSSEFYREKANRDGLSNQCKMCRKAYNAKYRNENRDAILKQVKENYIHNKDNRKAQMKEWYSNNSEYKKHKDKEYLNRNREAVMSKKAKYHNERYKNDELFRRVKILKGLTTRTLKSISLNKVILINKIFGCTWLELKTHLESQFREGMCWEVYGTRLHVDHIRPFADAKSEADLIEICHYKNLQPLWKEENMAKGKSYKAFKRENGLDVK